MSALVLDDQRHVARKDHRCDVCLGVIAAGDRYHRQRNIGDDGPYTFKAHLLCDTAYWLATKQLGLRSDWDEYPDVSDEVLPLVQRFFVNLCALPSIEENSTE